MKKRYAIGVLLACALPAVAATVHIPYVGGKQSGTFEIKGAYTAGLLPGAAFPDTVILDSALRVSAFTEESYSGRIGSAHYWLFLENSFGAVGFRNSSDTIWNEATTFPSAALWLDSIAPAQDPLGRFYPANLNGKRFGIKARKVDFGSEGVGWAHSIESVAGQNRAVYFRLNKPQGVRYGKLQISRDSVYTGINPVPGGNKQLASITVRYLMFSSAEYDATPMALHPVVPAGKRGTLHMGPERGDLLVRDAQGRFYNLHGRRVPAP